VRALDARDGRDKRSFKRGGYRHGAAKSIHSVLIALLVGSGTGKMAFSV
jgi:hypothetical protein